MKSFSFKSFIVLALASFAFFITLTGCTEGNTDAQKNTPAVALEEGWKRYTPEGQSYGLALPPEWKFVDLSKGVPDTKDIPIDPTVMKGLVAQGAQFLGYDPNIEKGKGPVNVSIMSKSTGGAKVTLDQIGDVYEKALTKQLPGAKVTMNEEVSLPAGKARKMVMEGSVANKDFSSNQYILLDEKNIYVITFSYTPDKAEKYAPIVEKIINTFKY